MSSRITPLPPLKKAPTRLEDYKPTSSGSVEALLDKMTEMDPELGKLLAARDKESQRAIIAGLDWRARQRSFASIIALTFHLQKGARHDEALAREAIALELVEQEPIDSTQSFFGRTRARNMGDVLASMGRIHVDMGNLTAALAAFQQADRWFDEDASLRERHGITGVPEADRLFHQQDFQSNLFAAMADVYRRLGDEARAAELIRKAWQHSQLSMQPEDRAVDLRSRAQSAREQGDFDAALGFYWEMLDLALSSTYSQILSRDVALALSGAAEVYHVLGLNRRALELYEQSLELNQRANNGERMLDNYRGIGVVHAVRGNVDAALVALTDALIQCSATLPDGAAAPSDLRWTTPDGTQRLLVRLDEAWNILHAMGRLVAPRDRAAAIGYLERAIVVIERLRRRVVDDEHRGGLQIPFVAAYDLLIDLLYESFEDSKDGAVLERLFTVMESAKSRVLAEMLADQPLHDPTGVPTSLLEEEAGLLTAIERLQARFASGGTLDDLRALQDANAALDAAWSRMTDASPVEGSEYVALRRARPLETSEWRALLRTDPRPIASIIYYATPNRLLVLTIRSDHPEIVAHAEPVGRDALRELALVDPAKPPPNDLRVPYWELDFEPLLVAPIRQHVEGYARICLVPHDVLHGIPIHALSGAGDDKAPLIEKAEVFAVPSASLLRYCLRRPARSKGNDLVLGNPLRPDQPAIPQTAEEARSVAAELGCTAAIGSAASRELVLAHAPDAEHIHIACHNEFHAGDPMGSGLLLSDEILTARDILGLRLRASLVVLSACRSGAAEAQPGDELIGTVRALLFAGTPSAIVSLWNTYDQSSARLMLAFYHALESGRLSKGLALAEAQRALRREGMSLAQWAPFVLIGDWR
jgi:tetratricopeptide (TPR) repeat protein